MRSRKEAHLVEAEHRVVAVQVAFERQILKPFFHLMVQGLKPPGYQAPFSYGSGGVDVHRPTASCASISAPSCCRFTVPQRRVAHELPGVTGLVTCTIPAVINWCVMHHTAVINLCVDCNVGCHSLPGVRLLAWTIMAVINVCFDRLQRANRALNHGCQIINGDHNNGCH
jgi:hypothetical protein